MKVSEVINAMGEASAAAQGLTKTITSAERLRNSENQKLYFLVDQHANKYVYPLLHFYSKKNFFF